MQTDNGNYLGGKRSHRDDRDFDFDMHPRAAAMASAPVPRKVDHRPQLPPAWDQQTIGSCEAHGCPRSAMIWWTQTMPSFMPSRLAAYAWGRQKGNFPLYNDTGCYTRDMLKVMQDGLYDDKVFPYDISRVGEVPPAAQRIFQISGYTQINTQDQLTQYVASGGCAPFAMALPGYFEAMDATGFLKPYNGEAIIGEHCMCIVGYDLDRFQVPVAIVCNSWGTFWGDHGHCYIPIDMILGFKLGGDCWSVFRSDNL